VMVWQHYLCMADIMSMDVQGYSPERAEREKERTPAWTDRVLWRSQPGLGQRRCSSGHGKVPARLLAYNSVGGMTFSDHRAVHALFCIQVPFLNPAVLFHPCPKIGPNWRPTVGWTCTCHMQTPLKCAALCAPMASVMLTDAAVRHRK
jgi:hypothetical protein